jgi:hypothetical protein
LDWYSHDDHVDRGFKKVSDARRERAAKSIELIAWSEALFALSA